MNSILRNEQLLLYAVTDRSWLHGNTLYDQVQAALDGGVSFVQLREKELDDEAFYREAIALKELCSRYQVPFVINDHVDIALRCDADGVHVGQSDMDAAKARELLGPDKIIGVSCKTVEQAQKAQIDGADYLGVGAMFPTGTKQDAGPASREVLRKICESVSIPVVAIGGITLKNLHLLAGTGISGIAVVSAIFAQPDPKSAALKLREQIQHSILV